MLELTDISKRVGRDLHIDGVNLSFERGSLNVLLGPTLSGKTTLMRLMAGLDKPTAGDISIDGQSVLGVSVRSRNVAMVYQQFINYPGLSVYENIASPMRLAKVDKKNLDRRVREAAALLKLEPYLDRTPLNLSGGQQQRTAIARALVKEAELVLLDEPLANLDYKLREELRVELPKIFAESGAMLVYATTEPHEALLLGGHTATLSAGRVTQYGKTIDVYREPSDLATAQTFADPPFNTIAVSKSDGQLQFENDTLQNIDWQDTSVADGDYIAAIRAHHVSLTASPTHHVVFPATVGTAEITGSETFVHVAMGEEKWVALTHGVHRVEPDQHLSLHINPDSIYLFDTQTRQLVRSPSGDTVRG